MDPVQVKGAPAQHLPEPGRYRHFKGNEYDLLMVARHSETEELLAVYCAVEDPERIWVRPVEMFAERVNDGGRSRPRFEPAGGAPTDDKSSPKAGEQLRGFIQRFSRTSKTDGSNPQGRGYPRASSLR
jgi:hypothetical protein